MSSDPNPQQQEPISEEPSPEPQIDPMADLQRQRDELESKYLRAAADLQNYIRRSQQNIAEAQYQQLRDLARSLINVLDHFDHALQVDPEKTNAADLLKGVQIVRDELLRALEQFGVQRLDVQPGEPFDPNRHEAVMRQAAEGIESNHVAMQVQPGYVLDDRTLRPAKVTIAE